MNAEKLCRDPRLKLGRQLRLAPLGLQRGIADRFRAEGVEPGGEMAVFPDRLDEGDCGRDTAQQLLVDRRLGRGNGRGRGRFDGRGGHARSRDLAVAFPVRGEELEQPGEARM